MAADKLDASALLVVESVQFLNLYPEDVDALLMLAPQLQETLAAMCV